MTHREKRVTFTRHLATLIMVMFERGYEVALDETTEHLTPKDPTSDHREGSFHHLGLAADLILYKDGVYLTKTEDHAWFGKFWESLDPECTWGGDFHDGNHYSYGEH